MNGEYPQEVESGTAVERTVHFSDAVVAIAITLLTLELRLPEGLATGEVPGHLLETLSGLVAFLVSYWVIASYWIAHHRIFNRIGAHDGALLTINFVFLMWVVLVPFTTSMVMEYGESRLIWDVYVTHLLLTGITLWCLWRYASKDGRLIEPDADLDTLRRFGIQVWIISAVFLLSIVISFFNIDYAQWFLLLLYLLTLEGPLRRRLAGKSRRPLGGRRLAVGQNITTKRRYIDMQSPIHALLYGIGIWFVWVSLVVTAAQILPAGLSGSALFVSMQMVALAALMLGSTILYLRKVGEGSFKEGLLIGLGWVVIMIALDLAHSVLMPEMVPDIGTYFAAVVPSYVVVPIITILTIGFLERRSPSLQS